MQQAGLRYFLNFNRGNAMRKTREVRGAGEDFFVGRSMRGQSFPPHSPHPRQRPTHHLQRNHTPLQLLAHLSSSQKKKKISTQSVYSHFSSLNSKHVSPSPRLKLLELFLLLERTGSFRLLSCACMYAVVRGWKGGGSDLDYVVGKGGGRDDFWVGEGWVGLAGGDGEEGGGILRLGDGGGRRSFLEFCVCDTVYFLFWKIVVYEFEIRDFVVGLE